MSENITTETRIYAIGDIHGRVDLLRKIHQQISDDSEEFIGRKIIVYIGDYIDRGFRSKEVIEELLQDTFIGFERVFLKGNHEHTMLEFLQDPESFSDWLEWGGDSCLRSYGVNPREDNGDSKPLKLLVDELAVNVPREHLKFLITLKNYYEEGDYLFVHAGLKPNVDLDNQKEEDMLMIRNEFIYSDYDFGKTVVFGHTVFDKPYQAQGRIGIDTGAYASGKLTCVVLENKGIRFLST